MTFTRAVGINNWGPAKFVVDGTTVANGTHSTIAAALTSASSGDTIVIRPGTYTENLTLKAGVNLTAWSSDSSLNGTGKVIISGTCTMTTAGSVTISGIQLQTNSAVLLAVTGSAASVVNLNNCYLNCTNNTGITFSSSDASAKIIISYCYGNIGTTGITYFAHSSAGNLIIEYCRFLNSGAATTASTCSSGILGIRSSTFHCVITTSSTATLTSINNNYNSGTNTTALTVGGSGLHLSEYDTITSGSASAISVGDNLTLTFATISSSNTNAITGAGTLIYSGVSFIGTSSVMNTTTQTAAYMNLGKWKASGQPSFMAYVNTTITNVTGDATDYTIIFDTEVFDQGADFNLGTSVFTAPVTGRYLFTLSVSIVGGTTITAGNSKIVTSNRTYQMGSALGVGVTTTANTTISIIADMDAADTANFNTQTTDGSGKVDDVQGLNSGNLRTFVSGQLVC